MPARGPARGQAGAGLPGAVAVPGLVLALPPVLRVPVVFCLLHVGPEGKLKAVVKEAESKLAIARGQGEQVLIHVLEGGRECREHCDNRRNSPRLLKFTAGQRCCWPPPAPALTLESATLDPNIHNLFDLTLTLLQVQLMASSNWNMTYLQQQFQRL